MWRVKDQLFSSDREENAPHSEEDNGLMPSKESETVLTGWDAECSRIITAKIITMQK